MGACAVQAAHHGGADEEERESRLATTADGAMQPKLGCMPATPAAVPITLAVMHIDVTGVPRGAPVCTGRRPSPLICCFNSGFQTMPAGTCWLRCCGDWLCRRRLSSLRLWCWGQFMLDCAALCWAGPFVAWHHHHALLCDVAVRSAHPPWQCARPA
jgi:hypothetical protein